MILNKTCVLKVNRLWQVLDIITPEVAFKNMAEDIHGDASMRGIRVDYFQRPDGTYETSTILSLRDVGWDEWLALPVRDCDMFVRSSRQKVCVPNVVLCPDYKDLPKTTPQLNANSLWERDKGICQYTRKKLRRDEATMDHVIPKSKGGRKAWDNIVLAHKEVNLKKGNRTNREAGLPDMHPKAPRPAPKMVRITECCHPDWRAFLPNLKGI